MAWRLTSENLNSHASGLIRMSDRAAPQGVRLEISTPSLSRLTGADLAGPAAEGLRLTAAPIVVADQLFKVRAEYAVPAVRNLSVSASLTHVGTSYADILNTYELPSYRVVDLGARYHLGTARNPVTLRLDVLNIADKHYWANATALGEPRTVMFSVNTRL